MSESASAALLEAAATAYREHDLEGRLLPPPAWWDLSSREKDELFRLQAMAREIERALHPTGMTTTARAVMSRIVR